MKSIKLSYVLFLLLFAAGFSCTPGHNDDTLTVARGYLKDNPDSTLVLLNGLNAAELRTEKDRAEYALLYSLAMDKCYVAHENDSLVNIAVDYYSMNGTYQDKMESYYIAGRVYSDMDSINSAFSSYLKALEVADKSGDIQLRGLVSYHIGSLYQRQRDFDNSDRYIGESIDLFGKAGDRQRVAYALNGLARTYSLRNDYEQSVRTYEQALEIFEELNDTASILNTAASIASVYYQDLDDPEKALEELTAIYDTYNEGKVPEDNYALLSIINFNAGNYDEAVRLLNEYLGGLSGDDHYKIAPTKYLLSQLHAATSNHEEAYAALNGFIGSFEDIHEQERNNLVLEIHKKYEKEQLEERVANMQRISNLQLIIVVLALLIAAIIIMRIVSDRRRTVAEKNKNIEELELYIESLSNDIRQIEDLKQRLSSSLSEKDEKERKLKEVLNVKVEHAEKLLKMASQYGSSPDVFMDKLRRNLLDDSRKEYFGDIYEVVNEKFHGIINHLKKEYPDLNNDDLNLCCLICFEFTVDQQTLLFGHSNSHSIYTNRNKLRKKFGLPTGERVLDNFMADLKEYLAKDTAK